MKVAHLIDSGGLYGAEQILLMLCKEQQKQGINPIIVSCGLPGEAEKPLEQAAKVQGIELLAWRMSAGINLKSTKKLLALLKEQNVQLLHSHGYKFNILLGLIGRRTIQLPLVATVHGYVKAKFPKKMWVYELLDRLLLNRFDAIVLVSAEMQELPAFKNNSIVHIIRNGINDLRPEQESLLEANPYQLLAIGRLSPEKGFEYLVRAVAELNKSNAVCQLTIMGEGLLRAQITNLIEELQQNENIKLIGFVANAQQFFHQYQLIVMPSLTEGIPVTLLEAMRNKTPVIASEVGGIPEVLGRTNIGLIEPASALSIVNKIKEWINLPSVEKASVVEKNSLLFQANYSAQVMAQNYQNIYASLTQKRLPK